MKKLIVLTGPTASGKTELSLQLASFLNTEIISADSRQVYKEMSIGTAKPSVAQLKKVKHHFINIISITEDYNAGLYEMQALTKLENLFEMQEYVILTGGSGLYINALLFGFDQLPSVNIQIRTALQEKFVTNGIYFLQEEITRLDPVYAAKVDLRNSRRMMRALEVCYATGRPYSSFISAEKKKRDFLVDIYIIDVERKALYNQIDKRVDSMVNEGLFDEAASLYEYRNSNALQTVGYEEVFRYMDGGNTYNETIELIKKNTRNYAKRQLTWFRRMENAKWMSADKILEEITGS